jgi:hypothetical protein
MIYQIALYDSIVKEILKESKKLIEKPENFTQGVLARDINDNPVALSNACKFCSTGAIWHTLDQCNIDRYESWEYYKLSIQILRSLLPYKYKHYSIADFNDKNSHAKVLRFWTYALNVLDAPKWKKSWLKLKYYTREIFSND